MLIWFEFLLCFFLPRMKHLSLGATKAQRWAVCANIFDNSLAKSGQFHGIFISSLVCSVYQIYTAKSSKCSRIYDHSLAFTSKKRKKFNKMPRNSNTLIERIYSLCIFCEDDINNISHLDEGASRKVYGCDTYVFSI